MENKSVAMEKLEQHISVLVAEERKANAMGILIAMVFLSYIAFDLFV